MSSPLQTPSSTPVLAPESTPSSPTTLNASHQPITMTPRTKIRSILQDIDDDSGSDDLRSPVNTNAIPLSSESALDGHQQSHGLNVARKDGDLGTPEDEDGDEDDLPVVPKGRMAARMRAQNPKTRLTGSSDEEANSDSGENAYERIKKQLAVEQTREKEPEVHTSEAETSQNAQPKVRRRLLLTKKKKAEVDRGPAASQSEVGSPSVSAGLPSGTDDTERRTPQPTRKQLLTKKRKPESKEWESASQSKMSSPGLFVTPHSPSPPKDALVGDEPSNDTDSDLPSNPKASSAFLALVAKKRKERQDKEAAENAQKAEKVAKLRALQSSLMQSSDEDSDQDASGRKLTQQSRPTRKASKRALEEMNRETQRLSRNMQLAHQARTKKKITKESFFARFNIDRNDSSTYASAPTVKDATSSATASSTPASDAEGGRERDTPPTSPLVQYEVNKFAVEQGVIPLESESIVMRETNELPSLEELMTQPVSKPDKGKGKALEGEPVTAANLPMENVIKPWRPVRVKVSISNASHRRRKPDSDDDLEILGSATMKKCKAIELLDRVPTKRTKEDQALLMLRSLAHLTSPSKQDRRNGSSISSGEMQTSLRQKARQQAAQERAEKIQQLKDRGVIIQTAEERERDQQEVEDLIEKGRREAADIGKKEKEAAKREGGGDLQDSGDEDEDYAGSDEREDDISGSEDEEEVGDEDLEDQEENDGDSRVGNQDNVDGLVEKEAEEDDSEDDSEIQEEETDFIDDGEENEPVGHVNSRKSRTVRVISDDDEEDKIDYAQDVDPTPTSSKFMIPGLPPSDDLPLGLTQAFAATMADSQTQHDNAETQEQDSLAILRQMPEPDFPSLRVLETDSQEVIKDSQDQESPDPLDIILDYTQTQAPLVPESPFVEASTQLSLPDPSQDMGFVMSPLLARRGPPSTVETVLLTNKDDSPVMKKKGRLIRRADAIPTGSDVGEIQFQPADDSFEIDSRVFDIMRKGAKKMAMKTDFDKSRSNAKQMVEEVAEESEDEYAGLGGASDESAGEEDEEDRKMINDDGKEKVDEQKLAALHADKERISDEAAVSKLYKDLTTGALRRKRGAGSDLDLSDSDDDGEAQRAAKRREFQRMRQAMFADEKLGKIADDKKKAAFLRAIEDREDDEDVLELDFGEEEAAGDSQSQSQSQTVGASQNTVEVPVEEAISDSDSRKRKRPLEPSAADASNRLPPSLRRTAATESKRPSTIDEIRQTVSFLVDEPECFHSVSPAPHSSDNEGSDEERIPSTYDENDEFNEHEDDNDFDIIDETEKGFIRPSFTARRTNSEPKTKANVVDRISQLRNRTSSLSSTSSRLAFHNPSTGATSGFRVPTLLRRATTNSSLNSTSSTNTSGGFGTERSASDDSKTKVTVAGGGKKASVNFYQQSRLRERERELKGRVSKKGKTVTGVAGKGGQGMLGLLGRKGSWD